MRLNSEFGMLAVSFDNETCCSDHMPFLNRGIPSVLAVEGSSPGRYSAYHTSIDTFEKCSAPLAIAISRGICGALVDVAGQISGRTVNVDVAAVDAPAASSSAVLPRGQLRSAAPSMLPQMRTTLTQPPLAQPPMQSQPPPPPPNGTQAAAVKLQRLIPAPISPRHATSGAAASHSNLAVRGIVSMCTCLIMRLVQVGRFPIRKAATVSFMALPSP
jgi:hypothetical protein